MTVLNFYIFLLNKTFLSAYIVLFFNFYTSVKYDSGRLISKGHSIERTSSLNICMDNYTVLNILQFNVGDDILETTKFFHVRAAFLRNTFVTIFWIFSNLGCNNLNGWGLKTKSQQILNPCDSVTLRMILDV